MTKDKEKAVLFQKDIDLIKRVAAVLVVYRPDHASFEAINSFLPLVDHLFVVDNSKTLNDVSLEFSHKLPRKITYYHSPKNNLAFALDWGVRQSIQQGYAYTFLVGEHTTFTFEELLVLIRYMENADLSDVGLLAMNSTRLASFAPSKTRDLTKCTEASSVDANSGLFLVNSVYGKTQGYNQFFGIDLVDYEMGYQMYRLKEKMLFFPNLYASNVLGQEVLYHGKRIQVEPLKRLKHLYRNLVLLQRFIRYSEGTSYSFYCSYGLKLLVNLLRPTLKQNYPVRRFMLTLLGYICGRWTPLKKAFPYMQKKSFYRGKTSHKEQSL